VVTPCGVVGVCGLRCCDAVYCSRYVDFFVVTPCGVVGVWSVVDTVKFCA
jgi:hypothetical protein